MSAHVERRTGALIASTAVHAAALALAVWIGRHAHDETTAPAAAATAPRLVWMVVPGAAGGGGGGGIRTLEPPRAIERAGRDSLTVPAAPSPPRPSENATPKEAEH